MARKCPETGKFCYNSRSQAYRAMDYHGATKQGVVYKCQKCNKYHFSKGEQRCITRIEPYSRIEKKTNPERKAWDILEELKARQE